MQQCLEPSSENQNARKCGKKRLARTETRNSETESKSIQDVKESVIASNSCKICNQAFDNKSELLKHKLSHLDGAPPYLDSSLNNSSGILYSFLNC